MNDHSDKRADQSQRFLFEGADIRGETVQLEGALREILGLHQYAPGVGRLLGEFLAAAVLLSTTLKFQGRLTLQARSEGQVPLIMAECDSELQIRGIARGAQEATAEQFDLLLGGGQLAITVDPLKGRRYQGVVPLGEDSLAHSLDAYFRQSEQLGTRLWLACDGQRAGGLLLQQLPAQLAQDPELRAQHWEHACTLAATLESTELLALESREVIHRLYHADPLTLFEPRPVAFQCSCSRERSLNALSALATGELEEILEERGMVEMDCEFCNAQYHFSREDLTLLLGPERGDGATVH
ncbi:Hsp33 family molecular chaperone HslO [Mangrovimicrobium sediminis]|uniref:33 kDa chaperonin n=1 Tax=Mangrovimicrobium sediminis TaxID=2562682 RepID=A0A4Z0M4P9_9GAMM|nr:Hsp33 family molecular chaperone HslO [Haliea sp. SAOS-164]TGD74275.1 Hsp33 family molecular chaperone HslO [Haliea sp. SAOS-164]